jgi:molybdopterin synthase sulfur carrier subunit
MAGPPEEAQMSVKVKIPTPLRGITGGLDTVTTNGAATLGEAITEMESQYPGLRERLLDDTGELRRFVNVYINGEDVRFLDGLGTAIKTGDDVSIGPAVAGG